MTTLTWLSVKGDKAALLSIPLFSQIDEPIDGGDHDRAADDVADRDRQQIAEKKFPQVRAGKSAAVLPIEVQKESGAPALMNRPIGMK